MPVKTVSRPASRADAEIRRGVLRRMREDFDVPDDRLSVAVENGVVTITGVVAHDTQREAAGNCARHVRGIRDVMNKIEVNPASATTE